MFVRASQLHGRRRGGIGAVCDCKHCQKQSGTAFGLVVGVPKAAFSLKGDVRIYHDQGVSGQPVDRAFCPNCGSLLTTDAAVMPNLIFMKTGTLDDTFVGAARDADVLRQRPPWT